MAFPDQVTAGEELIRPGLRSADYVEGVDGWRIGHNGEAQFDNVQVLNELGASTVSADAMTLDGQDLRVDILDPIPAGLLNLSEFPIPGITSVNTNDIGASEAGLFEWSVSDLKGSHFYMMCISFHLNSTAVDDFFISRVRYTVNGTAPTLSTGQMDHTGRRVPAYSTPQFVWFYTPAIDYEQIRMLVTLQRSIGTGTSSLELLNPNYAPQCACIDLGLQTNVVTSTISQKSKVAAAAADNDPVQQYTKYYKATWSRSFDQDNGTRMGDDTNDMYQGYYSGTHGRTFSLAGFDYNKIMADTAGSTIVSCKLRFKVKWIAGYGGLDVKVNGHDYTSKPSNVDQGRIDEVIASRANCAAGSSYTIDLGTSVGGKFKSGAFKGIGFGPAGSQDEYGRMYGETDSNRPELIIVYKK